MNINDIGKKRFWHFYTQPKGAPLIDTGQTHETEEPYREGTCRVFRLPFSGKALAVGVWGPPRTEAEALAAATHYRQLDWDAEYIRTTFLDAELLEEPL